MPPPYLSPFLPWLSAHPLPPTSSRYLSPYQSPPTIALPIAVCRCRPPLWYCYRRTCYRIPSPCLLLSLLRYPLRRYSPPYLFRLSFRSIQRRTNPSTQPDLLPPWSFRPVVVSFLPDHCRRPPLCSIPALLLLWYAYPVTSLLSLPNEEVKKALAKSANIYLYCHKNMIISELLSLTFYLWK